MNQEIKLIVLIKVKTNELGQEGWDLSNAMDVNFSDGGTKEIMFVLKRYEEKKDVPA